MRATLLSLALFALPFTHAVGCTSLEEDVCDARCDCRGCSDRDYDNCLDDYDRDFRSADNQGCPDLYDELVTCQQQTYVCRGTDFDTSCGNERERLKNCID